MSFQPDRLIKIAVATETFQPALLQGLDTWLRLNLDSDTQINVTVTTRTLPLESNQSIKLELSTDVPPSALLAGLNTWLQLGLLSNAQIGVELTAKASQPTLLEGLNAWVQLGLLPEDRVKHLCQENFTCPLPQTVPTHQLPPATSSLQQREGQPSLIGQIIHSLIAELSVMWLLLLGVFMVVVSSGVLAASQWQKFPAAGQYGVLFLYNLGFGGAGFWAGRQRNLHLTAQALRVVTLLLVPVNFLAMDSFGLWQNPLNLLLVAIATFALTALTVHLFRSKPGQRGGLPLLNHLGLSYLHWGWKLPGFPLVAVYLGMVGTAVVTFYQETHQPSLETRTSLMVARANRQLPFSLNGAIVVYAVAILLVRAIFIARVDISQLGLALGICGVLLAWLQERSQRTWERIGGSLLALGWLVSVWTAPWQAIAVSGLGLVFFSRRIQRSWQAADQATLFIIGLQMHWLAWRLVPLEGQQEAIALGTQLTGAQDTPWALLSLVLFPYLILVVGVADQLDRRLQRELASFGGWLALGFGTTLTVLSLVNPILRTLNLALSTMTLGFAIQRQWARNNRMPQSLSAPTSQRSLVYLTHTSGLLTLGSAIDCFLPALNLAVWAGILLILMVVEWVFSLGRLIPQTSEPTSYLRFWRQSCWHLGLILAALSYYLLLVQSWGVLWLVTPVALTWVASKTEPPQRQSVSWLSVGALGLAQILTLALPGTRLIGLSLGVGLMLIHTRSLKQQAAAVITVGFCLSFVAALLWEGIPGLPRLSGLGWLLVGAIALTVLWLLQSWLIRRPTKLARIYAQAIDGWAMTLCSIELVTLTLYSLGVYWAWVSASVVSTLAVALTMGAIAYRSWQRPNNWGIYGFGWGLEVLIVEVLSFTDRSLIAIAIANIALGLITRLVGDWWHRRSGNRAVFSSWHVMPLLYGALGATLRWGTFASWTGLSTLGVALIAVGVGRRREEFKPLVYLAMVGVSASAYEILLYEISGLPVSEQLIAMAALATSIVYAYRVLSPWLTNYLHLTANELKFVAHLHWGLGSCLLAAALGSPVAVNTLVGLGIGIFLIRYAIMQGRHHPDLGVAEIWVYIGIVEAVGVGAYGLSNLLVPALFWALIPWLGAIAAVAGYFLYALPWETWGWPLQPWQRSAFVLPPIAVGITAAIIHPASLLVAAGFYAILAQLNQQVRFTYISLVLLDWAIARWLWSIQLTETIAYAMLLGLSVLYVAQVDPNLKRLEQKEARHLLRLLGTGVICVFALFHYQTGILPGILSILVIFAGLALRVRAFLYVGTFTFLVNAFYQLVIFIFAYPLLKWIVGLLVGITFIWIAASFENRRNQITTLMRRLTEFQEWH